MRAHTIEHLDYYLAQLAAKVRENGGYVHFASSADKQSRSCRNIARHYDVRSVAKSKSMISEEIHLNDALEKDGLEVFETDLGEYIIQLAGETPSHIVGPALHKTREDMAELLLQVGGETAPNEIRPR